MPLTEKQIKFIKNLHKENNRLSSEVKELNNAKSTLLSLIDNQQITINDIKEKMRELEERMDDGDNQFPKFKRDAWAKFTNPVYDNACPRVGGESVSDTERGIEKTSSEEKKSIPDVDTSDPDYKNFITDGGTNTRIYYENGKPVDKNNLKTTVVSEDSDSWMIGQPQENIDWVNQPEPLPKARLKKIEREKEEKEYADAQNNDIKPIPDGLPHATTGGYGKYADTGRPAPCYDRGLYKKKEYSLEELNISEVDMNIEI